MAFGASDDFIVMRRLRRDHVVMGLVALVVFGGLALFMWQAERAALQRLVHEPADAPSRVVAQVQRSLRSMELVTIVIETKVTSSSTDDSWRGDVAANVTTPVRLLYGTDLSQAKVSTLELGPISGGYLVHVPTPARIGSELRTELETADVSVGWLRLRSRAGEYQLGLARRGLSEAVMRLVLSQEDAAQVREETRRRVAEVVKMIVAAGRDADVKVSVTFDDEAPASPVRVSVEGERK